MKAGAKNQWEGIVTKIKRGTVMCVVEVQVGCGNIISSVMTLDSLKNLGLKKGSKVKALVKAINVLLVTDK
ncbi:MAG: TOBE domain-containing protein [Planctomycetota bacterium]